MLTATHSVPPSVCSHLNLSDVMLPQPPDPAHGHLPTFPISRNWAFSHFPLSSPRDRVICCRAAAPSATPHRYDATATTRCRPPHRTCYHDDILSFFTFNSPFFLLYKRGGNHRTVLLTAARIMDWDMLCTELSLQRPRMHSNVSRPDNSIYAGTQLTE